MTTEICRSLHCLYPPFAMKVRAVVIECQRNGVPTVSPFETWRSVERQNELYAKGRSIDGKIVTYAKGGFSFHQYGLAVDFAFKEPDGTWHWDGDVAKTVEIVKESGLTWGGPKDQLHFEWKPKITVSECLTFLSREGQGVLALWNYLERKNLL